MRIHNYLLAPALFAAAIGLSASPQTLIDNDQVRVVKVTDQPHSKSQPHEHKLNRVMIYLQPGRQDIIENGKKVTSEWKAGQVKWSPASGTHTSEVISSQPVTMIEVEIKGHGDASKSATSSLDPVKVDPRDYKVEFENSQVRVVRVRMAAKHKVPMHEHLLNRVVVYLTDQNGTMTTPDGATTAAQHKAGDASWGGPAKHSEQNMMDGPFEGIMIELKS